MRGYSILAVGIPIERPLWSPLITLPEILNFLFRSWFNEEILRIGENNNKVPIIETESSLYSILDAEIEKISHGMEINWLQDNNPNLAKAKAYLEIHQGKGIPLHRIITEMHNGKIMGSFLSYIFSE